MKNAYEKDLINKGKKLERILNDGGLTVAYNGRIVNFGNGYQVGGFGPEARLMDVAPLKAMLKNNDFVQLGRVYESFFTVIKAVASKADYVGFWIDEDVLYADGTVWISNKADAIKECQKRKQKAAWDWSNFDNLYVLPLPE